MSTLSIEEQEKLLGTPTLMDINCLSGMGITNEQIIRLMASKRELTNHDIAVARSWWARNLPTPVIRRIARRLTILLCSDVVRYAIASEDAVGATDKFSHYLAPCPSQQLSGFTVKELKDVRQLASHHTERRSAPPLEHHWAGLVFYALHRWPRPVGQIEQSIAHHLERFRFWLSRELGSIGLKYDQQYFLFFIQYIRWLEHYNPLDR